MSYMKEDLEIGEITENKIKIEIEIPESMAAKIFNLGSTPTEFFKEVINKIQNSKDLSKWIANETALDKQMCMSSGNTKQKSTSASFHIKSPKKLVFGGRRFYLKEWTKNGFEHYMDFLVKSRQKNKDLLLLLEAYVKLGPIPRSIDLQREIGIINDETWFKEFRATKARLTIYAKKMGIQTCFYRAQGNGKDRFHPMDPDVHKWLLEWTEENKGFLDISNPKRNGGD